MCVCVWVGVLAAVKEGEEQNERTSEREMEQEWSVVETEREKELASVVSLAAEPHWTDFTHTYFFPTPPHVATYLRRHTFASFLSCSLLCCIQRGTGSLSFSLSFSSHSRLRTLSFKPRSPWLRH